MPGGRIRHKKTYNHPYPDFSKLLPHKIFLKLQEQWTNIHYKTFLLRFWIVYKNRSPKWYVVEVPKLDNILELHCYTSDGNQVYKWNDRNQYTMMEHLCMFMKKSLNETKSEWSKSFPGLLTYYGTLFEGSNIKITPKPPPPPRLRIGGASKTSSKTSVEV